MKPDPEFRAKLERLDELRAQRARAKRELDHAAKAFAQAGTQLNAAEKEVRSALKHCHGAVLCDNRLYRLQGEVVVVERLAANLDDSPAELNLDGQSQLPAATPAH